MELIIKILLICIIIIIFIYLICKLVISTHSIININKEKIKKKNLDDFKKENKRNSIIFSKMII